MRLVTRCQPGGPLAGGCSRLRTGAVLSHRDAAAHWGLLAPVEGPVHVVVPGRAGPGTAIRDPDFTARGSAGRATSPAIAACRSRPLPARSPTCAASSPRRRSGRRSGRRKCAGTRSAARSRPITAEASSNGASSASVDAIGLPEPEVNVRVGSHLVDFLWREQRLIVETDGFRYHRGRQAFDDDRSRDLELRLLGFEVIRLSAPQIRDQSAAVASLLSHRLESPSTD